MTTFFDQSIATPPARLSPVGVNLVDAVANWCEALHGATSLQRSLEELVKGIGAEAGLLVRTDANAAPVIVASCDRLAKMTRVPLQMSFADCCFGPFIRIPRSASCWIASLDGEGLNQRSAGKQELQTWQRARGIEEFAALVIGTSPGVRDHIELHFTRRLSTEEQELLVELCPTLARTWATRKFGVVTGARKRAAPASDQSAAILTMANPARLTRAEFRICHMLSQGLNVAEIADELGRSEATIRSHLRSIYAKTSSDNIAQLTYRLVKPAARMEYSAQSA